MAEDWLTAVKSAFLSGAATPTHVGYHIVVVKALVELHVDVKALVEAPELVRVHRL